MSANHHIPLQIQRLRSTSDPLRESLDQRAGCVLLPADAQHGEPSSFVLAPKLTLQRLDALPARFGVSAGGASSFRSSQRLHGGLAPFFEFLRIKAMFATPGTFGCFIPRGGHPHGLETGGGCPCG